MGLPCDLPSKAMIMLMASAVTGRAIARTSPPTALQLLLVARQCLAVTLMELLVCKTMCSVVQGPADPHLLLLWAVTRPWRMPVQHVQQHLVMTQALPCRPPSITALLIWPLAPAQMLLTRMQMWSSSRHFLALPTLQHAPLSGSSQHGRPHSKLSTTMGRGSRATSARSIS